MHRGIWTRILRRWVFRLQPSPRSLRKREEQSGVRTRRPLVRPHLENLEDRTLPAPTSMAAGHSWETLPARLSSGAGYRLRERGRCVKAMVD